MFFIVVQCWIAARRRVLLWPILRQCWLRPLRNVVAKQEMIARSRLRSHFGSSHFLLEHALCFSCFTSFLWFCRVQVSTTQFCSFPPVLMANVDDGWEVRISPEPDTSLNHGSPQGSGPDLDGMGHRSSFDAQFKELRDILLPLARGFAEFDNHVKTISDAVGAVTSRITSVEQNVSTLTENVSSLTARICQIEVNATSVSGGSGSANSWNLLGHWDGSTATGSLGSHGPGVF